MGQGWESMEGGWDGDDWVHQIFPSFSYRKSLSLSPFILFILLPLSWPKNHDEILLERKWMKDFRESKRQKSITDDQVCRKNRNFIQLAHQDSPLSEAEGSPQRIRILMGKSGRWRLPSIADILRLQRVQSLLQKYMVKVCRRRSRDVMIISRGRRSRQTELSLKRSHCRRLVCHSLWKNIILFLINGIHVSVGG